METVWCSVAGVVAVPSLFSLPCDVLMSLFRSVVTHVHTVILFSDKYQLLWIQYQDSWWRTV